MTNQQIKQLIAKDFPQAEIQIEGDGCSLCATVISEDFNGLNQVKRRQAVYRCLSDYITNGTLHAVTLKTLTPDEVKDSR